jgi:hypothetical protein
MRVQRHRITSFDLTEFMGGYASNCIEVAADMKSVSEIRSGDSTVLALVFRCEPERNRKDIQVVGL